MKIGKDKAVTVNYTLRNEEGQVVDTSQGREPLSYIHGSGSLIKGFETALEGKSAKESVTFTVRPEDGYGEYRKDLLFKVPKERFQGMEGIEVGTPLRLQRPEGSMVVVVADVGDDYVVLDGNHPLAGATLTFDVEVLGVRDATAEELQESCGSCASSCESCSCEEQ